MGVTPQFVASRRIMAFSPFGFIYKSELSSDNLPCFE